MKEAVFKLSETIKKGLAPKHNVRNRPYLVQALGAYSYENKLRSVRQFTQVDTTALGALTFPYPQIFICSDIIIICTSTAIYEYESGTLTLKLDFIPEGVTWTCIDYKTFIYLSNCTVSVTKDPSSGEYSIVDIPYYVPLPGEYPSDVFTESEPISLIVSCRAGCDYNGQVVLSPCTSNRVTPIETFCIRYINTLSSGSQTNQTSMIIGTDEYIYCVEIGNHSTNKQAVLKKIDPDTLTVVKSQSFDLSDMEIPLRIRDDGTDLWILASNYGGVNGYWTLRVSRSTFSILDRRTWGSVVLGTDGNHYYANMGSYLGTSDSYRPITGGQWSQVFSLYPGGVYPFHVSSWSELVTSGITGSGAKDFILVGLNAFVIPATTLCRIRKVVSLDGTELNRATVTVDGETTLFVDPSLTLVGFGNISSFYPSPSIYIFNVSDLSLSKIIVVSPDDPYWRNMPLSGAEDSIFWHPNGFIYILQDYYQSHQGRIIKVDPINGTVVASYTINIPIVSGEVVFSGRFIFWFQNKYGDASVGGIIKLDLDLNLICIEPFNFTALENAFPPFGLTKLDSHHMLYYLGGVSGNTLYTQYEYSP